MANQTSDTPSPAPRIKVPRIITIKLNEHDIKVAETVMNAHGITDGVQLVRFSFRAAEREILANSRKQRPARIDERG